MFREIIKLENVSYAYPRSNKNALEGINLLVMEGEFLAVMGEDGAGKTTFCKLINGIIPHFSGGCLSGTVTVDGINTKESSVPQLALKAGMVMDDPDAQIFTSTVYAEAAFGPENILLPAEEIERRVVFALSAVGLSGFEDRPPSTLSGGEKQRLSIAAALSMKGKILVLDEPLCRLDPDGAEQIMSVLKDIREKYQITVVMAAHNSAAMAEFADRICILKNGQIAALDTAKNIFENRSLLEENGIRPLSDNKKPQSYTECPVSFDSPLNLHEPNAAGNMKDKKNNKISEDTLCNAVVKNKKNKEQAVEIKNFCFAYPNGATIKNINLSIADNDFTAIIGNNGCGKTTLLKNITGLLRPCSGDIYIRGRNTKELSVCDISREAGFVMQNPDTQLFTGSVYSEVAFALKKMRLSKAEIKRRVEEALDIAGLGDGNAFPPALNRVDRKKTVIACILAMGCKIIIFDEIDTALDYHGGLKIMDIARALHSRGFTIIFVTHNIFLADEYAHTVIRMHRDGIRKLHKGKVI